MLSLTHNIVLLGEGFPVTRTRVEDFDYGGNEPNEKLRVPVLLQIEAGPYSIVINPERFQCSAQGIDPSEDSINAICDDTNKFAEFAGSRSITGIGHNFVWSLTDESIDVAGLRERLVSDAAASVAESVVEIVMLVSPGDANAARAKVAFDGDQRVVVDMNYHFDPERNNKITRPQNAIGRLPKSAGLSQRFVQSLSGLAEKVPVK